MTEKYNERQIKETLDNLEVPFNLAHWEKLEQKMNAPFVEENPPAVEEVDKIVYPKLTRLEPAFKAEHWDLMATRLRQIAARRRQIVSSKLLETAIFLLLILNLPSWLGMNAPTERTFLMPRNQAIAEWNEAAKSGHLNSKISESNQNSTVFGQNFVENVVIQNNHETTTDAEPNAELLEVQLKPVSIGQEIFNTFRNFILEKTAEPKPVQPNPAIAQNNAQLLDNQLIDAKSNTKLDDFSGISARKLAYLNDQKSIDFLPLAVDFKPKSKRQTQIGVFTGLDYNFIRTPAEDSDSKSVEQLAFGYSTGLLFSRKTDKIGCETGISYSAKTLNRNEYDVYGNVQNGYFKQLLEKQEFAIIGIPVRATVKIGRIRHTTISARAGMTANIVMQKNSIRKTFPTSNANFLDTPAAQPLARKISEEHQGFFEGGHIYNNSFVTADLAIRFERPIGGKLSVFVQPTLQKIINPSGLGVRSDKLTTVSLQLGLTTTL
jgi:Outer membrane protein beta-barrel domain